jgi:hypothetical protein
VVCENTTEFSPEATVDPLLTGYTYHWSLPDGWTSSSSTGSTILVYPNGLNGGTITLHAEAFGKTSTPCEVNIPLEPIEPSTIIEGLAYVCNEEFAAFQIVPSVPPSSTVTWTVSPSEAVSPSAGTGEYAFFTASGAYSGEASINFQIVTLCGTVNRQYDFYVGYPKVTKVLIDGKPGTFAYVCPDRASHWIYAEYIGDENDCAEWDDFGTTSTNYSNCNEFDFTFNYNPNNYPPYDCAFVSIILKNECTTDVGVGQTVVVCPSYWACKSYEYELILSPNPASSVVNVNLVLNKGHDSEQLVIPFLDLIDFNGNLISHTEVNDTNFNLNVSTLDEGLYYVRTWIEEGYVVEQLIIERD